MQEKRNLVGLETEFYLCLLCEEAYQDAEGGEGMLSGVPPFCFGYPTSVSPGGGLTCLRIG
jgi:hypothetical protein